MAGVRSLCGIIRTDEGRKPSPNLLLKLVRTGQREGGGTLESPSTQRRLSPELF